MFYVYSSSLKALEEWVKKETLPLIMSRLFLVSLLSIDFTIFLLCTVFIFVYVHPHRRTHFELFKCQCLQTIWKYRMKFQDFFKSDTTHVWCEFYNNQLWLELVINDQILLSLFIIRGSFQTQTFLRIVIPFQIVKSLGLKGLTNDR